MIDCILIIGQGSAGHRHARIAKMLYPNAEICHVRDKIPPLKKRGQGGFLAVIANPAPFHLEAAHQCVDLGAHLLIEKPISHSSQGVQDLIDRCRELNRVLTVGYNLRFSPSLNHFKSYLSEGRIGKVLSVRSEVGQYLPSWRPQQDYRKSVSAQRQLGGGVLLELSHEVDYLRWIFGEVVSTQIFANKQSDLEIDVEDTAHVIIKFQDGLVGRLDMDFVRHDRVRQCVAIGEHGSLKWDALRGSVEVYEAGGSQWQCLFEQKPEPDETYIALWQNWIRSVRGIDLPRVTGEDALLVLKTLALQVPSPLGGEGFGVRV